MLKPAISLDADMSAGDVLERLAMHGFWLDLNHPVARARLGAFAARLERPTADVAAVLAQDARKFGAAIRRQWGVCILWYSRELQEVLELCTSASPETLLVDVLNLHESDARPTIRLNRSGDTALAAGVVMDDTGPVGASFDSSERVDVPTLGPGVTRSADIRRSAASSQATSTSEKRPWPRIESPDFVSAGKIFNVVVGFGIAQQTAVAGGPVTLGFGAGTPTIDVTVELVAGSCVQATDGWSRVMRVRKDDVASAAVTFELVGVEPAIRERPSLTMLEVRYVVDGVVCGTAARPLVIVHSGGTDAFPPQAYGEAWIESARAAAPVTFVTDDEIPDLTIEISKPDRNVSSGRYVCTLYSPHSLAAPRGPFQMELGQDAKTFARAIVEEVRLFKGSELLDNTLEGIGRLVAQRLPGPMFDALREVAAKIAPKTPAVLIVSAEPYVPWELAWVEPPLDHARPCYLGAQVLVGRWLRESDYETVPGATGLAPRPAIHPIASLAVRNLAVMAAWYKAQSGLCRLPKAEAEAKAIAGGWGGLALSATAQSVRQLLQRSLDIGSIEAVHFAGHGDFDPGRPDSSALFLEDGTPLRSTVFRTAKYGGEQQPLMFLNACMLGIGGEVLGDMAGFPGSSLRGGFGGVLGALWEVDDTVAHDIALEFWKRALPPAPQRGEPIGSILLDLRAKYRPAGPAVAVSTYLAYVYYGHPRLTLERAMAGGHPQGSG